jgi:predicted O-linked N-acetylglucosamine transferase (SPINDLY family)
MNPIPIEQSIQIARQHHQAGRLAEADKIYRQILARQPNHADALHAFGVLAEQTGRLDAAVESIQRAIQLRPDWAEAHGNLGNVFKALGKPEQAIESYRQAIRLKPDLAGAHNNLGNALLETGRLDEAVAAYRRAIQIKPDFADAHYNLGSVLQGQRNFAEAIACYRQAIRYKPQYEAAYINLGIALSEMGEMDEAIAAYRQAIRIKPQYAETHSNLGNALKDKGQLEAAIVSYRQAIRLKPDYAEALNNLGNALKETRRIDEAIVSYRRAIGLKADYAAAHSNLGSALTAIGQIDEAIAAYRQAIQLKPDDAKAHSNLIFTLHYHPDYDAGMIREELRRWNQQHAQPLKRLIRPHTNNCDPDRRLRIGYVSGDFRDHVVGQNLLPLLREHDHREMEIFCYVDVLRPDAMTEQLRQHADAWRGIVGLPDFDAANLIRQDGIDILVDLALHSANNRLGVFAQKPAPVQATYLGYCGSTGIDAMDYRLSDPYLDPPNLDSSVYSEQTMRLPETYWCYGVSGPAPEPSLPPAAACGFITFGCLNNFAKVSRPAMDLWAEILRGVPSSRLIIHSHPGQHLIAVRERFAGNGVSPDRLEFAREQPWPKYVQTYERIDIAFDPFPWGGGITTFNALWMGVPVVTLAGQTAIGRGGASILSNLGEPKLIASTKQEYVQIAMNLANDLPRLIELRRTLRARMRASPLMDAPRFARNMEAVYREIWRKWCESRGGQAGN